MSTRGIASMLAILVLYLLWKGKQETNCAVAFWTCALVFTFVSAQAVWGGPAPDSAFQVIKFAIVCVTIYGVYAYTAQLRKIYREKSSAGLSKIMNATIVLKDIATVMYAVTYDLHSSWPLVLQGVVNGMFRLLTL